MSVSERLKKNFMKMFEKMVTDGEPLNNYLLLVERRWKSEWYRKLFPKDSFSVRSKKV
jgi:hypothetical protein